MVVKQNSPSEFCLPVVQPTTKILLWMAKHLLHTLVFVRFLARRKKFLPHPGSGNLQLALRFLLHCQILVGDPFSWPPFHNISLLHFHVPKKSFCVPKKITLVFCAPKKIAPQSGILFQQIFTDVESCRIYNAFPKQHEMRKSHHHACSTKNGESVMKELMCCHNHENQKGTLDSSQSSPPPKGEARKGGRPKILLGFPLPPPFREKSKILGGGQNGGGGGGRRGGGVLAVSGGSWGTTLQNRRFGPIEQIDLAQVVKKKRGHNCPKSNWPEMGRSHNWAECRRNWPKLTRNVPDCD